MASYAVVQKRTQRFANFIPTIFAPFENCRPTDVQCSMRVAGAQVGLFVTISRQTDLLRSTLIFNIWSSQLTYHHDKLIAVTVTKEGSSKEHNFIPRNSLRDKMCPMVIDLSYLYG